MAPLKSDNPDLLIHEAKAGNSQAFGRLYDAYFEKIYKFIFFRVSHKETAEDLTEDTFVKAWTRIAHVNVESFSGWLYSIARNTVIDHYRQKKILIDLEEVEGILEDDQDIVETTNGIIEKRVFLELLKQLTPEQQIIVQLKFIEDLDNAEISELISKSEGSIRVVQHRAVLKLQKLLKDKLTKEL